MPDLVETPDNDPATQAAQILNRRLPDKAAAKKKEADDEASEFGMSILRNSREENKETQKCPLLERNAAPRGKHQRVRFMSDVAEQDEVILMKIVVIISIFIAVLNCSFSWPMKTVRLRNCPLCWTNRRFAAMRTIWHWIWPMCWNRLTVLKLNRMKWRGLMFQRMTNQVSLVSLHFKFSGLNYSLF